MNRHLDTVGVAGMEKPFAGSIVGDPGSGQMLGRGACDTKAGVTAAVTTLRAGRRRDVAGP
jgi:acetylornithine deacetylase/succinyl-diaminopimelate desuccinylase-like protein